MNYYTFLIYTLEDLSGDAGYSRTDRFFLSWSLRKTLKHLGILRRHLFKQEEKATIIRTVGDLITLI
jgi:uncharacterized protein YijF (DUF1287 family)